MGIKKHIKKILPERVVDVLVAVRWHRQIHGCLPSLMVPKTFNEKVTCRKLFDRRPILTEFADKFAVRDYVAKRIGEDILPALYYTTKTPADIPFDLLPEKFVVKPTHGSGWVQLVNDKSQLDRAALIKTCEAWLAESFYAKRREWVYKNIEPRIIIEELVNDGSGGAPNDYKFFTFNGRVEMIQVQAGRFKDFCVSFFDRNLNPLQVKYLAYPSIDGIIQKPPHFEQMLEAAEILGKDIDFVRVDFYDTERKTYFGELTTTPGAGFEVFEPASYDRKLGDYWKRKA